MNIDEKERILSRGLPNIHHVNDTNMVYLPSSPFSTYIYVHSVYNFYVHGELLVKMISMSKWKRSSRDIPFLAC